jgi:hypothetical protein
MQISLVGKRSYGSLTTVMKRNYIQRCGWPWRWGRLKEVNCRCGSAQTAQSDSAHTASMNFENTPSIWNVWNLHTLFRE